MVLNVNSKSAGAGGGFRCMRPSANTANKLSATHESRRVRDMVRMFINAFGVGAGGGSGMVEGGGEGADVVGGGGGGRWGVKAVWMREESAEEPMGTPVPL